MATLADSLRPLAKAIRAIPGQYGVRTHRVYVVSSSFGGAYTGDGAREDESFELVEGDNQPPKVRWLKADEITVGNLPAGSVSIEHITPDRDGSTTIRDAISGAEIGTGGLRYLKIVGPNHPTGALYRVTSRNFEAALHYTVTASPVEERTQ